MIYPSINEKFVVDTSSELYSDDFLFSNGFKLSGKGILNTNENFPKSRRKKINNKDFDGILVDYLPVSGSEFDWHMVPSKVYAITFDEKIVKIGQTSKTLKDRFGSYACGTRQYRERGTCSTTNFHLMEAAYAAIMMGQDVSVYSFDVPKEVMELEVFGETVKEPVRIAHIYENVLLNQYKKIVGKFPVFSSNG